MSAAVLATPDLPKVVSRLPSAFSRTTATRAGPESLGKVSPETPARRIWPSGSSAAAEVLGKRGFTSWA